MPDLHLRLYDTLTAQLTPLVPRHPGAVGVYTCGPTTYDVAHIGHARAAVAPDVLVRHLRAQGIKVTYVRNITDVEDKILKRAQTEGTTPLELSSRMAKLYQEDVRAVGCADPDVEPRVSDHIPEIIGLVERLIALGAAYEVRMPSGARDVYYSVRAFPGYGKLSKRNVDDMRVGARVEACEDKRDPLDFALWKGCSRDEGDALESWGWDSPWGKGRPGWHIECSAMSARYLGHGFDVHCGGMDLIFPHHENEIAQSEAAHPGEGNFVSMWIHNGFVNVDKEKMSKSLGNFVTIRDVLRRNDAEALRCFLLGVHYRGPINFDVEVRCLLCGAARQLPDPKEGDEGRMRVLKPDEPCPGCGQPGEGRVVFPGVVEAERRVDYIYQALGRLARAPRGGRRARHVADQDPPRISRPSPSCAPMPTIGSAPPSTTTSTPRWPSPSSACWPRPPTRSPTWPSASARTPISSGRSPSSPPGSRPPSRARSRPSACSRPPPAPTGSAPRRSAWRSSGSRPSRSTPASPSAPPLARPRTSPAATPSVASSTCKASRSPTAPRAPRGARGAGRPGQGPERLRGELGHRRHPVGGRLHGVAEGEDLDQDDVVDGVDLVDVDLVGVGLELAAASRCSWTKVSTSGCSIATTSSEVDRLRRVGEADLLVELERLLDAAERGLAHLAELGPEDAIEGQPDGKA